MIGHDRSCRWMTVTHAVFLFLLCHGAFVGVAQDLSGPVYPCPNCDQRRFRPEPVQGMWYNPQQSGTGITFTIRNHHLVGTWYGYDAEGNPEWLLFSAAMQAGATPEVLWTVDAELQHYRGGSCPSCDYQPPQPAETVGQIHLEFDQLAHASFTVTLDGEEKPLQNIIPTPFGGTHYEFIGGGVGMPDMQGLWWVLHRRVVAGQTDYIPEIYKIGPTGLTMDPDYREAVANSWLYASSPSQLQNGGSLVCDDGLDDMNTEPRPFCEYKRYDWLVGGSVIPYAFAWVPVGNLRPDRLAGESHDNYTDSTLAVEGRRFRQLADTAGQNPLASGAAPVKLTPTPPPPPSPLHRIDPVEGMWYNPQKPGTGFTFYLENQHLGGTYYGYDENGEPFWLVFVGPLQPADRDAHQIWNVEADLIRYSGGQCLGCPYQFPENHGPVGSINLTFYQMKRACYSMIWNGSEVSDCVFAGEFGGVPRITLDESFPTVQVPALNGDWLVILKPFAAEYPEYLYGLWNYASVLLQLDEPEWVNNGNTLRLATLSQHPHSEDDGGQAGEVYGQNQCSGDADMAIYSQPLCSINWQWTSARGILDGQAVTFDLYHEDIDENHFFAESPEGHVIEGFKITTEPMQPLQN